MILCLWITLPYIQFASAEIWRTDSSDAPLCTQASSINRFSVPAANLSPSNILFPSPTASSNPNSSIASSDESGVMASDTAISLSLTPSIISTTPISSESGENQQNAYDESTRSTNSGSTSNPDSRPAWFSYLITFNNIINGLFIAYFSLIYDRSSKKFHGLLVRELFSKRHKRLLLCIRVAAYVMICLPALFASLNLRGLLIVTSCMSCLITLSMLCAQHNYNYGSYGNKPEKAQKGKAGENNRRAKPIKLHFLFRPLCVEECIEQLNTLYLKLDLQNSTHTWTKKIVTSIVSQAADVGKNQCLWQTEDIVFYLRCGYMGWIDSHKYNIHKQSEPKKEAKNIQVSENQKNSHQGGTEINQSLKNTDFEALLELSSFWDYFCMFQQVQQSLLNAVFNKTYSVERVRLILDAVNILKKELNLAKESDDIRKLQFDLTVFLTYTNLLVHLVSHSQEELLEYLADDMITPITKKTPRGDDVEVGSLFEWLKMYSVLLLVQFKLKKSKINDSDRTQEEKKELENQMIQLQFRFDFSSVPERFDLLKPMLPLSIQKPRRSCSSSGVESTNQVTMPLWYSNCILYYQQMKIIKGG